MKKWVWIIIGILVVLGAGAGVFYGVMTHEEPGFMGVCWGEDGKVDRYHDPLKHPNPDCKTELKWAKDKLPLTYFISFDEDHKDYIESVDAAAKMWNTEIGPVFKKVDKEEEAVVQVVWGGVSPGEDHPGGSTTHTGGPEGPTGAKVTLVNPSDVHAVMRYAAHEFGHVLGLAHDEAPRSIMYPKQPDVAENITFVLPSDFDKKILRAAYR